MTIYYVIVFLLSLMHDDLRIIVLFSIGTFNLYLIDLVNILLFISFIQVISNKSKRPSKDESWAFIVFLSWLIFGIVYGLLHYGLRALGEGRVIIYSLFAFFIPFYLPIERTPENIVKVLIRTLTSTGIGAGVIFIVEIMNGGRFFLSEIMRVEYGSFEDFRGTRFLSTEHTFALCACMIMSFYSINKWRSITKKQFITILVLLIIILISKNRAATISLFGLFVFRVFSQKKIKYIVGMITVTLLILIGIALVLPENYEPIVKSFSNLKDISSDPTGNWRIMMQIATIEQAMQHPVIGQGYGGYFTLFIPELNIVEQNQPHSEYAYLFLKSGIIGVILCIIPIIVICRKLSQQNKYHKTIGGTDILSLLFILIGAQIIYGFAYNFSLFYGLYYGFAALLLSTLDMQQSKLAQGHDARLNFKNTL